MPAGGAFEFLPLAPTSLALLLAAIADSKHCDRRADIARLAEEVTDWEEPVALAKRHHVTPHFHLGLERAATPHVPPAIRARLQEHFAANLKRKLLLARHAGSVLKEFAQAEVRVLPYKGVFLAQTIHGHFHSREVKLSVTSSGTNSATPPGRQ